MVAVREREGRLEQRAKDHINAADQVIDDLVHEINQLPTVIDYLDGTDRF